MSATQDNILYNYIYITIDLFIMDCARRTADLNLDALKTLCIIRTMRICDQQSKGNNSLIYLSNHCKFFPFFSISDASQYLNEY